MEITMPSLDTVLRVLEILSIIGGGSAVAFGIFRFIFKMEAAIQALNAISQRQSNDIGDLKLEIKKLNDVLTSLAVQAERLNLLQHQIDELRHGRGLVLEDWPWPGRPKPRVKTE
jgi:hypothetical protein